MQREVEHWTRLFKRKERMLMAPQVIYHLKPQLIYHPNLIYLFNVKSMLHDPRLRTSILDYHLNLQDEIRREYITRGLC